MPIVEGPVRNCPQTQGSSLLALLCRPKRALPKVFATNIRLALRLDTLVFWIITSPNMHKVHHSRDARYTDTNFGNMTSLWDRAFGTFTSARIGTDIDYGLEGHDHRQTTLGLLAEPWQGRTDPNPNAGLRSRA